jgi:hypothetical protein
MQTKLLIALIIFIILFGSVLILAGINPLFGGGIALFMVYFLWKPPSKHKEFSDADRMKATTRALGGSGPPELWTPQMPEKKHHKHKKKRS